MDRFGMPHYSIAMMRTATGLLLVATSLPAWADLEALQEKLAEPHALQGSFEQRHWLTDRDTRLHSEGRFLYYRDQYVIWHYHTPMEATLRFQTAIMSTPHVAATEEEEDDDDANEDGERGDTLEELLPGRIELEQYLVALMGGNWPVLQEEFTIDMQGKPDDWEVMLTPSAPPLETYLSTITLSGGEHLEHLTFNAANGDELEVSLIDITPIVDTQVTRFLVDWFNLSEDLVEESVSEEDEDDDGETSEDDE